MLAVGIQSKIACTDGPENRKVMFVNCPGHINTIRCHNNTFILAKDMADNSHLIADATIAYQPDRQHNQLSLDFALSADQIFEFEFMPECIYARSLNDL